MKFLIKIVICIYLIINHLCIVNEKNVSFHDSYPENTIKKSSRFLKMKKESRMTGSEDEDEKSCELFITKNRRDTFSCQTFPLHTS